MEPSRRRERTIAGEAGVCGVGFLTGADVRVRFRPAPAGAGVTFVRADLPGQPAVPAHVRHVTPRQRRTTLQRGAAVVEMVEHVMAALAGLRIDNCTVELDAAETPGLDGSSRAYVEALDAAGLVEQDRLREVLVIDRPVSVREGRAVLAAHPGEADELVLAYNLDYGRSSAIAPQGRFVAITPESFRADLAPSRTFLLESEAVALRAAGVGARTTVADLLVFGPDGPIGNALRFPDECARHKILDMVGDLALLGKDLVGHVVAHRSGHQQNAELARALLVAAEDADRERDRAAAAAALPIGRPMDVGAIMGALPHRYPFLLVDRVLEHEPGRRVVAVKNVTCNEPFFQGHWPGRPIMPGVLIVEAMAQAAGLMIAAGMAGKVGLIASIDRVKLRRPVVPGDQLRLEATCLRAKGRSADVQATARVDGRIVAEAKLRFVLVEADRAA